MSKHTPGPWDCVEVVFNDEYQTGQVAFVVSAPAGMVGSVRNRRLIAAAPDLLEALKAVNAAACYVTEEDPSSQRVGLQLIGVIARDVIAKAEGQS